MNRIIYYFLILLGSLFLPVQNLSAQQEDAFAQFMYYKQAINPAQTGSSQGINITGLVRNQWIGLSGAPKWQSLLFSMPLLNNRVGVGGNIYRHSYCSVYMWDLRTPKNLLSKKIAKMGEVVL